MGTSGSSSFPSKGVGIAVLGAALILWRLRHALASAARLEDLRADLTTVRRMLVSSMEAGEASPEASTQPSFRPSAALATSPASATVSLEGAPSFPANDGSGDVTRADAEGSSPAVVRQAEIKDPLTVPTEEAGGDDGAIKSALAAALAAVEAAALANARSSSVQQAASLLIGTVLENLTAQLDDGSEEAARFAVAESFKSAQIAVAEISVQLGTLLAEAQSSLAEIELALGGAPAGDETSDMDVPPVSEPSDGVLVVPANEGGEGGEGHPGGEFGGVVEQAAEVVSSLEASDGPLTADPTEPPDSLATAASWSRLDMQVSKFTNFADLNGYRDALAAVPGVRDVKIRRVHKGVLFLSVDYEGIVPLTERLQDIREHPARRVAVNGDTIQVALTDEDPE